MPRPAPLVLAAASLACPCGAARPHAAPPRVPAHRAKRAAPAPRRLPPAPDVVLVFPAAPPAPPAPFPYVYTRPPALSVPRPAPPLPPYGGGGGTVGPPVGGSFGAPPVAGGSFGGGRPTGGSFGDGRQH